MAMKIMIINNLNSKLRKRLFRILAVLGIIGSFVVPLIPLEVRATGNTYYVSTTGSDAANGSLATPWLTPQHAANTMVAGDTCYIEAGTYGLSGNGQRIITEHNGAPGAPITFQNYNGGVVTIFSSGLYSNLAILNNYIDFIGLNCVGDNTSYGGACIESSISNILIQNCSFSNFEVGGIYMDETASRSDITVTGCTFNGTNTTSNMEIVSFRDVNGFTISNNLVENPAYANRCGICTAGCSNGSIYNNTVYNTSSYGIYVGPSPQNAGSNVNVYDNLVYNCQNAGLAWADEVGYGDTSTAINFYNNIVYGNYRGFELDQNNGNFTVNFSLINNIFYHNGGSAGQDILVAASNSELSNCIIRNNIIDEASDDEYAIGYNNYKNGGITVDHNLYYNSGGAWSPSNVFGTNYVTGNPLLTSPTINFSLQSGSPAIGAGSSANAPATDYIGTVRPQDGGWDIGAYEFISSGPNNPSPSQPDSISIITGKAFQNIYQSGDILIIFEYDINYAIRPDFDCSDLFYIQLRNGLTVLTPTNKPLYNYGVNMAAFYFSKADVTSLGIVWGSLTYQIEIDETNLFAVSTAYDYSLSNTNQWITESNMSNAQGDVQSYIINVVIGGKTGIQAKTGTIYLISTSGQTVVNSIGRIMVLSAIPYIDTPIPQLFQLSTQQIIVGQQTIQTTGLLQDNLTLQNQLGTQLSTAFTNFGALLHISGQQVAMGWILLCILIVVSIVFLATGNLIGASICALPMVIIGVWIGAIPVAFVFSAVMIMVVLLAFYLFIRGM